MSVKSINELADRIPSKTIDMVKEQQRRIMKSNSPTDDDASFTPPNAVKYVLESFDIVLLYFRLFGIGNFTIPLKSKSPISQNKIL